MDNQTPNVGVENGVITRIYVKNFVTYDEVTVRPGRNLNLILGPNGTGKSTLVGAIILGLGGNTKLIGRADNIGQFVKDGERNAVIEIDLQNDINKYVTIKRCFDVNNQTNWFVNNKSVSGKQISEIMKRLNIQIDNLCQFLPQDKVQDFSKMEPPELLRETERSVGDPTLIEQHEKLIELRKIQAELEKEISTKNKELNINKLNYNGLKDRVGYINEQKQIKKKLLNLKQKKAWITYQSRREELVQRKKERDNAKQKKEEIEKKIEPIKLKIAKLKSSILTFEKTAKQSKNETTSQRNKLIGLTDDIDKHEKSVTDIETLCQQEIKSEQERDERINHQMEEKNKLENDIAALENEIGSENVIEENLKTVTVEMNELRKLLNSKKQYENLYKEQIEHNSRKIRNEEAKLKEVSNIENKRLDLLHGLSPDAYNGVLWLRENRHLFCKPIHEPMLLLINLKDPSYSKYFENLIAIRDLTAFVCEDKNDMNLLLKYLRGQQKLVVNAVHSDPRKEMSTEPRIPLQSIKQYGFEHYLVSLIEAPQTILNYLILMYKINNIPIGNDRVSQSLDQIPATLRLFFTETYSYSINLSRYTNEKSTRQSGIRSKNLLSITIDKAKIQRIEHEINCCKQKIETVTEELRKCQKDVAETAKKVENCKVQRNKLETDKSKINHVKIKINLINQSVITEQRNRKEVNDIRMEFKKQIQNVLKQQVNSCQSYSHLMDECFKSTIKDEEMKLQMKIKKDELANFESDTQELISEMNDADRNFKILDRELAPLKLEVKNLYEFAQETTGGLNYDSPEFAPYKTVFAKLPASIEEINVAIQNTQAKIFSLNNDANEAKKVLEEYNNLKASIDSLTKEVEEKGAKFEKVTENINEIKNDWYSKLSTLVDKININFRNYFQKMRCAGEVSVSQGDNQLDFDKYGLVIRVKFRDSDELQVLTRNKQSGGERAVTTALYMISLQELTKVPFRCVDEINQGMDAKNERKVFDLIVDITSKSNSAQYFLLTPKLLPNLKYNETITVLTVYNGKYAIPTTELDLSQDFQRILDVVKNRSNTN